MKAILLALSLLLPTLAHSADYSGTWVLDKSKSSGLPSYYDRVKSHTLVNKQGDGRLEVMAEIDTGEPQADRIGFVYRLDGRLTNTESEIRTENGLVNVPTTLRAQRDADGGLHIAIARVIAMGRQQITSYGTEDWQLSEDGKTLNVRRTDDSPRGKTQSRMVFVKA